MAKLALNTMISIFVFMLGFMIILGIIPTFTNTAQASTKESICRGSIIASQKLTIDSLLVEKSSPRLCDPIPVGELKGTREEIKYQISELSAKCWWMWLEGAYADIFKNDKDQQGCAVCYYFTISGEMDQGTQSAHLFFQEAPVNKRDKKLIEVDEFYNYMLSTTYDKKILYGGGTKQYIGDSYEFQKIPLLHPKEISLKDINVLPAANEQELTFIQDFTGLVSINTKMEINELGKTLLEHNSLLFVIVADEIQRNDKTDARRLIESLGMNSARNRYDAVLITIDVTNGQARIHAGQELEVFIKELEIQSILRTSLQGVVDEQSLDRGIKDLATALKQKIIPQESLTTSFEVNPRSFYTYLSNDGISMIYLTPIETDLTYAIGYTSHSSIVSWSQGWQGRGTGQALYAIGTGVTAIAGFFWPPAWYASAGLAATGGKTLKEGLDILAGRARLGDASNGIIIARAPMLNEHCKIST